MIKVSIFKGPEKSGSAVWRQAYLEIFKMGKPAYLLPKFHGLPSGGNDGGLSFQRHLETNEKIDIEAIALAVGLRLAPDLAQISSKTNKRVRYSRTLNAATIGSGFHVDGPLAEPFKREISDWIHSLKQVRELTQEQIDLIMRLANDPRVPDPSKISDIFADHEPLQDVMLPWLFDRLEEHPPFKKRFISTFASKLSQRRISVDRLAPYAPRFRKLVKNSPYISPLLHATGRFGFDPAPLLGEIYYAGTKREMAIVQAICNSEPKWRKGLAPIEYRLAKKRSFRCKNR